MCGGKLVELVRKVEEPQSAKLAETRGWLED